MSSPPVVLSCDDSPLAIAGAVLTFFTFAYAIMITVVVFIGKMRDTPVRLRQVMEEMVRIEAHFHRYRASMENIEDEFLEPELEHLFRSYCEELQSHLKDTMLLGIPRYSIQINRHNVFYKLLSTGKLAAKLDQVHEILPKARAATEGCGAVVKEIEARRQDKQRLQQNRMLITIFEMMEGLDSERLDRIVSQRLDSERREGQDDLIASMLRPRKPEINFISRVMEPLNVSNEDETIASKKHKISTF